VLWSFGPQAPLIFHPSRILFYFIVLALPIFITLRSASQLFHLILSSYMHTMPLTTQLDQPATSCLRSTYIIVIAGLHTQFITNETFDHFSFIQNDRSMTSLESSVLIMTHHRIYSWPLPDLINHQFVV
jgi:hypothetical protein